MHTISSENSVEEKTIRILNEVLAGSCLENLGIRLWNGKAWPDERPRAAWLVLKHRGALGQMLLSGTEIGLAEAYLHDDFDVEGDIESAFHFGDLLRSPFDDWKRKLKLGGLLLSLPRPDGRSTILRSARKLVPRIKGRKHSPERDRRAVTFHYDLSNDFYRLWLDRRMVYSCAYFRSSNDDLDAAQEQKLDYICRKLRLRPGQRLLDIGCGWGALVIYAAKHFGVRAEGITLSEPQAEWARSRIADEGLQDNATVDVRDYREIGTNGWPQFDAIASVGMAEHVGRERLPDYFAIAYRALKPGGIFLNQAIGEGAVRRPETGKNSFIGTYVFPDGDIPALPIMLGAAESAKFEVRDVESLREHYARTLRHWLRRLEAHCNEALLFVDEPTYRVWRLYIAGSAHGFQRNYISVYQTLLVKPDSSGNTGLPLTRHDLYR